SAIKNLYKEQGVQMPVEFNDDIKDLYSGIRKEIASKIQQGEQHTPGKLPLSFSDFENRKM
ncbi:hypothetical protein LEN26_013275, partial [Aphanomyces euteiches]